MCTNSPSSWRQHQLPVTDVLIEGVSVLHPSSLHYLEIIIDGDLTVYVRMTAYMKAATVWFDSPIGHNSPDWLDWLVEFYHRTCSRQLWVTSLVIRRFDYARGGGWLQACRLIFAILSLFWRLTHVWLSVCIASTTLQWYTLIKLNVLTPSLRLWSFGVS